MNEITGDEKRRIRIFGDSGFIESNWFFVTKLHKNIYELANSLLSDVFNVYMITNGRKIKYITDKQLFMLNPNFNPF